MKPSLLLSATVTAAFAAAACGGTGVYSSTSGSTPTTPTPAAPAAASSALPDVTTVKVASTKLGQILVDGSGRTVYLWEVDRGPTSNCYDACAQAWPPVLTTGTPLAGTGVDPKLLGTSTRKDGQLEVDYKGHPLYYFIADKNPGDLTGQGLNNFGGSWYVLSPAGNKVDNG